MRTTLKLLAALPLLASACAAPRSATTRPAMPTIRWNPATLTYVGPGGYARIVRIAAGHLLLSVEVRGKSFVRHSIDNGESWGEPLLAAEFDGGTAANPQPLVLRDGTIWLLYNERPRPDSGKPFTIRLTLSRDGGNTWTPRPEPLYTAGMRGSEGCWEPSAIETSDGEILVFFANEAPYASSDEQEITLLSTTDRGTTFSKPRVFCFRAHARDGMPVPTQLGDGSIVVAIEDSGLTPDGQMKPVIARLEALNRPSKLPITPESDDRWPAVEREWQAGHYAGAPYLVQTVDGHSVLSVQSVEFSKEQRMVVYVGDVHAKHFANPTIPFAVDAGHSARWNSLFLKGPKTVTAISGTRINGKEGIWTIDGEIVR